MGSSVNNTLYRAALFWAKAPPDTATYLCAILERPDLLLGLAIWAANAIAGELFTSLLIMLVTLYLWPKLPTRVRSFLISTHDHLFPGVYDTEDRSGDGNDNSRELEDLREELEAQRAQIRSMDRRIDWLERELEEAHRSWWRRLIGK